MPARPGSRGLPWWDRAERWFVGALGVAALALAAHRIVARYLVPEHAISWSEELVVYLLVAATFVAGSLLVEEDGHVRADLLLRLLPPGAQRGVEAFNCAIALVFCALLAWFGIAVCRDAYVLDERSLSELAFPMWVYDASLPLGAALMTLRYLRRLLRLLAGGASAPVARAARES
jgi:TRAP-type C4-dicarboxylate transport system permease small subunit